MGSAVRTAARSYHDDWIVNVLMTDGRVYSFVTEMWPEHGDGSERNWPHVIREAERIALDNADRLLPTWTVDAVCTGTDHNGAGRYLSTRRQAGN